jgi:hypothetical protein
MATGAVLTALLLSSAAPASSAPATPAAIGQLLADKLDVAFRACALQITSRGAHLVSANAEKLAQDGIVLGTPPAQVREMSARLFGDSGVYASVAAPTGQIWISGSATLAACKVTVSDTELALTGRYDWTTRLRRSSAWHFDKARSGQNAQLMRDFFVLNADRPGPHMLMFIDGPGSIYNEGKGIQMIMTVTLEAPKAR